MDDPLRDKLLAKEQAKEVLILIVMDDPLREEHQKCRWKNCVYVLILIVMDDPLRDTVFLNSAKDSKS